MRSLRSTALAALVLAAGAASSARASVLWRGDFETNDLSQWSKIQAQSPDRLHVVSSPIRQGAKSLRVELRQGDVNSSGCRAELVRSVAEVEGNDRWYSWSTYFPSTYPINNTWQVITQWHHSGPDGSPPLEVSVNGSNISLFSSSKGWQVGTLWKAPLTLGRWHDFVLHVKWSSNASVGFVELWYDGAKVLNKKYWPTMYAGQVNYLKQGLYRNASITQTAFIWHDGMTIGTSMYDVAPSLWQKLNGTTALTDVDADVAGVPDVTEQLATPAWLEAERADVPFVDEEAMAQMGCSTGGGGATLWALLPAAAALVFLRKKPRRAAVIVRK